MNPLYRIGWSGYRAYFVLWHRVRICNAERVPRTGAVILASNHASFLDPPLVGACLPRPICYLARESLFANPIGGAILRRVHAIPVDRDGGGGAGLKAILNRLANGNGIILFPEGTRTRDGRLQPARSGIGLTVIKSGAPVVPVRVFGTFDALNRKMKFPRPVKLTVKFGRPLEFAALRAEAKVCPKPRLREIYQQTADEILAAIAKLDPCRDKGCFP